MKGNKIGILLGLMLIALASIAYGACTVISPPASASLSGGAYLLNVTTTTTVPGITNCSLVATSVASGDTLTATLLNHTGIDTELNVSINTAGEGEANDWVFAFTCNNPNGTTETCSRSGVTIDNGVPAISDTSPADGEVHTSTDRAKLFSVTCTNATAATLYYDNSPIPMTESSDVCSYTMDYISAGGHTWYVIATDGTDYTQSSTSTITIRRPGGVIPTGAGGTVSSPLGESDNGMMIGLMILGAYFIFGNKTGSKDKKKKG